MIGAIVGPVLDWTDNREKDALDEEHRQAHLLYPDDGRCRAARRRVGKSLYSDRGSSYGRGVDGVFPEQDCGS